MLVQLSEDSPQVRYCIQTSLNNVDEHKTKLDTSVQQVWRKHVIMSYHNSMLFSFKLSCRFDMYSDLSEMKCNVHIDLR